jgi:AcrR family transcriptional regulator
LTSVKNKHYSCLFLKTNLSLTDRSVINIIMSPRTKKQFEDIRQEKRELIIDTALEVFATHGYHGASVSMIANHAGIAKGLIYNYFKSKEELLYEIVNQSITEIDQLFDPNKDGILTAEEAEYFLEEYCRLLKNNLPYWKFFYSLMLQPLVLEIIKKQKIIDLMVGLQKKLMQYLEKCGFENPEMESQILHCTFDGITYNTIMNPEGFPLEKLKEYLLNKYSRPFQEKARRQE